MKNLLAPRTLEFSVTPNDAARSAAEHADIIAEPGFGHTNVFDQLFKTTGFHRGGMVTAPHGAVQSDVALY